MFGLTLWPGRSKREHVEHPGTPQIPEKRQSFESWQIF